MIEERDSPDIVEKELDGNLSDKGSLEMEDKRSWYVYIYSTYDNVCDKRWDK